MYNSFHLNFSITYSLQVPAGYRGNDIAPPIPPKSMSTLSVDNCLEYVWTKSTPDDFHAVIIVMSSTPPSNCVRRRVLRNHLKTVFQIYISRAQDSMD